MSIRRVIGLQKRNVWQTHSPVFASTVVLELILDHAHHNIVADQPSRIHDLLRLDSQLRLFHHLLAQHVSRRQVANTKTIAYFGSLRALA
jgi:hypothetical protein